MNRLAVSPAGRDFLLLTNEDDGAEVVSGLTGVLAGEDSGDRNPPRLGIENEDEIPPVVREDDAWGISD